MTLTGHEQSFASSALNDRSTSNIRHRSFRPLPLRARSLFADIDLSQQCGNCHDILGSGIQERSKAILEAFKAKTVNRRGMASGYAGLDNELFYMDMIIMVFGNAKKVVEGMFKAVEA